MSLAVAGMAAAVTVAVVVANQKPLIFSGKWEVKVGALCWVWVSVSVCSPTQQTVSPWCSSRSHCSLYLFGHVLHVRNNSCQLLSLDYSPSRVWGDRLVSGNWDGETSVLLPASWSAGKKQWCPSRDVPPDMKGLPGMAGQRAKMECFPGKALAWVPAVKKEQGWGWKLNSSVLHRPLWP